jgi:iron complex outermembrane recepter protein
MENYWSTFKIWPAIPCGFGGFHMSAARTARLSLSALLHAGAAACAAQAGAAENTRDLQVLQEVIVTATKRSEKLQDVPVAVSAITTEDIQARGFTQYADYLNSVPGVFFQDTGPGTSQIRMRGISSSDSGVPSTTSTYFGESLTSVLTNHGGKPNLRLVDIDRVEVLRGPQGTLFGASALAGVVRIIPTAPNLSNFEANVGMRGFTTAHSEDGSYHLEGTVNIPLVQDRLALRLVAYKDDIAGYIDNISPARDPIDYSANLGLPDGTLVTPGIPAITRKDINSEDTWGVRAALTWQVSDRLKVDLTHATQDVQLNSEPFAVPAAGDYEQDRAMDFFEEGGSGERMQVNTLVVNYDWDAVSLVAASNWSELKRFTNQDITFLGALSPPFLTPIPWGLHDRSIGKLFTQELRLQSRGDGPLRWLVGGFFLSQDADLAQFVPDYSCPTCAPEVLAGQNFGLDAPLAKFSEEEQRAIFAEVSYDLTERWTLGVGARYLEDDLTNIGSASEGILGGGSVAAGAPTTDSAYEFNPSAYLRFKPTDDTTLYAQLGRGFRAGTVNQVLPDACLAEATALGAGAFTKPDTLWNYEIGAKTQFAEGRLAVNTAVYRQKWKGVQLGTTLNCGFSTGVNGGDAINDGVELEITAQPVDAWRFNLAASYNTSEFDKVVPGTGYVHNERLPDVPEKNFSAGAQFNFDVGTSWIGFVRADYVYVGDIRLKFGTDVLSQDAFDTTNLRLAFQHDALAVELFARNVTDKRGVVTTDQPDFGYHQFLIRPRELGVELRYAYR